MNPDTRHTDPSRHAARRDPGTGREALALPLSVWSSRPSARAARRLDRTLDSPVGEAAAGGNSQGLFRFAFDREDHDSVLARLATEAARGSWARPTAARRCGRELDEYFAGTRHSFDIPVDLQLVHGFRRTVLARLRDIPYGERASYAAIGASRSEPGHGPGGRERMCARPAAARRAVPPGGAQRRKDRSGTSAAARRSRSCWHSKRRDDRVGDGLSPPVIAGTNHRRRRCSLRHRRREVVGTEQRVGPPVDEDDRAAEEARVRPEQERHERRELVGVPARPTGIGNASTNRPIFASSRVACSSGVSTAPGSNDVERDAGPGPLLGGRVPPRPPRDPRSSWPGRSPRHPPGRRLPAAASSPARHARPGPSGRPVGRSSSSS